MPPTNPGKVLVLKFLNRTNEQYTDDQVFWSATVGGVLTTSSIAAQSTFQLPVATVGEAARDEIGCGRSKTGRCTAVQVVRDGAIRRTSDRLPIQVDDAGRGCLGAMSPVAAAAGSSVQLLGTPRISTPLDLGWSADPLM
jgi:hypothetical protein